MATTASETMEQAIFFNVGHNCGVAHALLGAWILSDRGTIIRFKEIHDELVCEAPTVQGVGAALGLAVMGYNIPTDAVTVSRVKTFGTVLHAMLPAALQMVGAASIRSLLLNYHGTQIRCQQQISLIRFMCA